MGTKKMLDADEDVRPPVEPRSGWTKTKHSSISGQRLYQGSILECEAIGEEVEKCSDLMNESEYEKFIDRELEEEENASYKSYP